MEGFIPEILESPKYSITKEGLKPKLYSGNIANHPDANNSMTDWFKVISYLTPNKSILSQKYGNPTKCEEEFQDYSEDDFSKLLLNLQSPADIRLPRTC